MSENVYTPEFTASVVERYQAVDGYEAQQAVLRDIEAETGVKVASLRAKLSREGVYQAKPQVSTSRTIRKAELISQLAVLVNEPEEKVESFEKATRKALEIVIGRLRAIKEAQ